MLFKFGKVISWWCSFSELHDETIMHLFYDCLIVRRIWNQLKSVLSNNLHFPINRECHLQILGFRLWGIDTKEHLILNHLLLIFKMYIYNSRTTGYLNKSHLLMYIKDIKDTQNKLCEIDAKRRKNSIRNGKMF